MDLVLHRLDERRHGTVITRRDGVSFYVAGVGLKYLIPHDLAHLAVEGALQLPRGFWGTVAAGGVFGSMTHLRGRRRPHADARSQEVLKANRGQISEAEGLVALFNGALEAGHGPESMALRQRLRDFAWTPPGARPRALSDADIRDVCASWHRLKALWTELPIGGRVSFVWSSEPDARSVRFNVC